MDDDIQKVQETILAHIDKYRADGWNVFLLEQAYNGNPQNMESQFLAYAANVEKMIPLRERFRALDITYFKDEAARLEPKIDNPMRLEEVERDLFQLERDIRSFTDDLLQIEQELESIEREGFDIEPYEKRFASDPRGAWDVLTSLMGDIEKIKAIRRELEKLPTEGFEDEVEQFSQSLAHPGRLSDITKDFDVLKNRLSGDCGKQTPRGAENGENPLEKEDRLDQTDQLTPGPAQKKQDSSSSDTLNKEEMAELMTRGMALFRQGDPEKANECFLKVLKNDMSHKEARYFYRKSLPEDADPNAPMPWHDGKAPRPLAPKPLKKADSGGLSKEDEKRLVAEGMTLFRSGEHKKANAVFLSILEKDMSHREARFFYRKTLPDDRDPEEPMPWEKKDAQPEEPQEQPRRVEEKISPATKDPGKDTKKEEKTKQGQDTDKDRKPEVPPPPEERHLRSLVGKLPDYVPMTERNIDPRVRDPDPVYGHLPEDDVECAVYEMNGPPDRCGSGPSTSSVSKRVPDVKAPDWTQDTKYLEFLGLEAYQSEDLEGACEYFKQIIKVDPNHVTAYSNMGFIRNSQGKKKQALYFFNKALSINPNFTGAWLHKGMILMSLGDINGASMAFYQVLRLEPDNRHARESIMACLDFFKEHDRPTWLSWVAKIKALR